MVVRGKFHIGVAQILGPTVQKLITWGFVHPSHTHTHTHIYKTHYTNMRCI
jgi:hypothetical protein